MENWILVLCRLSQFIGIITAIFIIWVLVVCIKSKIKHKTFWILFTLFGSISFWGQINSDTATAFGISIPIGAIAFMMQKKTLIISQENSSSDSPVNKS